MHACTGAHACVCVCHCVAFFFVIAPHFLTTLSCSLVHSDLTQFLIEEGECETDVEALSVCDDLLSNCLIQCGKFSAQQKN